jgi:hypothetical protein
MPLDVVTSGKFPTDPEVARCRAAARSDADLFSLLKSELQTAVVGDCSPDGISPRFLPQAISR